MFWIGFIMIITIVVTYIIMMIVPGTDPIFGTWVSALTLCGIVLIGAILMLAGRWLERKSGDDV